MEGKIGDDADFARLRAQMENMIVQEMRHKGYVPVFDLGPYWSTSYNKEADNYDFMLSVYGVYVGGRKAWRIHGISDGREIKRYTPPDKSQQQSNHAE